MPDVVVNVAGDADEKRPLIAPPPIRRRSSQEARALRSRRKLGGIVLLAIGVAAVLVVLRYGVQMERRVRARRRQEMRWDAPLDDSDDPAEGSSIVTSGRRNSTLVHSLASLSLDELSCTRTGPSRLHISIYENASSDDTPSQLYLFSRILNRLGVGFTIVSSSKPTTGRRIEGLAELRNKALQPLFDASPGTFDRVLFLNDVHLCEADLLEIMFQHEELQIKEFAEFDLSDRIAFYDTWVARDLLGLPFYNIKYPTGDWELSPPLTPLPQSPSRELYHSLLPFQVFSCFNGATVLDASLFTTFNLRFRSDRGTDDQSECFLICQDIWRTFSPGEHGGNGRGARIQVVPRTAVGYELAEYEARRNDRNTTGLVPRYENGWVEKREMVQWQEYPPKLVTSYPEAAWSRASMDRYLPLDTSKVQAIGMFTESGAASAGGFTAKRDPKVKRRWILNAFEMGSPGHINPGGWRQPGDTSAKTNTIKYWTDLAQTLERGKFNGVFVADVLGLYDVYEGSGDPALKAGVQVSIIDPFLVVSAMATVTKNLTFGLTHSVTYEQPFTVARRFSTLDLLTNGRVGFNVVTSHFNTAARNLGLETQIEHDERYRRADEYLDVAYKLWESSWRDDAVVLDKETDTFTDPSRVRKINHKGKYFSVAGPYIVEPTPQRTPLIYQAGGSPAGLAFAAKHAEAVFLGGSSIPKIRQSVDQLRGLVQANGRDPYSIKIILGISVIVAETDEKAQAKKEEVARYASNDGAATLIGGWVRITGVNLAEYGPDDDLTRVGSPLLQGILRGISPEFPNVTHWNIKALTDAAKVGGLGWHTIVGSPKTVADQLEAFIEEGDVDGFNFSYFTSPGTFEDIVDHLVPHLQERGVHWLDYPKTESGAGLTARESLYGVGQSRLRDDAYGAKFKWGAGQEPPALD
ncbi:hypothetical protein MNV49_000269 [Pseudohyphozyma bogoriensis]|nr:hypothetical protein MNV49_000269 [Pseudohyphozyma bogoriensis]